MKDCIFCDKEKVKEDTIYKTDNFFGKVGIGIITPGHIIMIPWEHYTCYADLPHKLEDEYKKVKNLLQNEITKKFSEPFLIEYGIWGQTVPHAHTHFIPLKSQEYQISSILEEMVIPGKIKFEEVDRKTLKETYKAEKGYVSIEEKGKLYVCHINGIPDDKNNPNLTYRVFFTQKGLRGIKSWAEMTEEDKIKDKQKIELTKIRLSNLINKI